MDYYLEDKARLKGQPKRTIAEYVKQNGILVPRIFDSLREARESGLEVIARSEHEQDYDGISGVINSVILPNEYHPEYEEARDEEELKERVMTKPEIWSYYCRLSGINEDEFKSKTSFSFWEFIPGLNRTITADSAIQGKYHITTKSRANMSYTVYENGKITLNRGRIIGLNVEEDAKKLIEFYEKIRTLPRFDKNHCPIIEVQTTNEGVNYFLQAHRTRDFKERDHILTREKEPEEMEAIFVRGSTPKEGREEKVIVYYPGEELPTKDLESSLGLGNGDDQFFQEVLARKTRTQFIPTSQEDADVLIEFSEKHKSRSALFKPEISLVINAGSLLRPEEKWRDFYDKTLNGKEAFMIIRVISDGNKAYIRRID